MKLVKSTIALLVLSLSPLTATPASAQLADPLSLAASGVLLPFFSDPAAGFVSILEIASPVGPTLTGFLPPVGFTNPIQAVFFDATCTSDSSASAVLTSKQAIAIVSSATPLFLTFNGLAAIATSPGGNDLVHANFPLHSRVHWIDAREGRVRELEPITVATFLSLPSAKLPLVANPGAGGSVALPAPFVWNPLRSAATFVTPQESASVRGSIYLICPRASIQSPTGGGVFPSSSFPPLVNRDGSFGFPEGDVFTGHAAVLRARVYDDNEVLSRDAEIPCDCLTVRTLLDISSGYGVPPTNLGGGTTPVWYTEIESTEPYNSFTGYWGLEVAGSGATFFHRMGNASLDNLSSGTANPFGNR